MTKFTGWRGEFGCRKALEASRRARVMPRYLALADGTAVGMGDDILRADTGLIDVMLYGARGQSLWMSEARELGILPA